MICYVYKSLEKHGAYLYIRVKANFEKVPEALLNMLGRLDFVMELDIVARKTLANANPLEVKNLLNEQGYYLQLPPSDYSAPTNLHSPSC